MSGGRSWPERLFVVAFVAFIALAASRMALRVTHGLRGEYFETIEPSGSPVLTVVDDEISTDRVTGNWLGSPPTTFFVRWTGYLAVDEDALYTFTLTSDDGSTLSVDGRPLVDNGGRHSEIARSERVRLDRGSHLLVLEYFQSDGPYAIHLSWAQNGAPAESLPAWRLSTSRVPSWKTTAARLLDRLWLAAAILSGALLAWLVTTSWRPAVVEGIRRRPALASLLFFVALSVVETWPLATNPARLSRNDNGDTVLNEWTLAWVVHEAPRAPQHLYDGNIFYPERDTVAYSESLIVQSLLAAPILWLGGSPVLAYNLVLLAGFALTGWTMSLVVSRWTGDRVAGLVSGILFAFNAHTLTRLPHLQAQHVEFLPLALLALDALLRDPRARHALWLALWFTLQGLTSMYLLVLTAVAITTATLARPEDWAGRRFTRVGPLVVLAAATASLALAPFLAPYWRLRYVQGFSRSVEEAMTFSASWRDYASTPGRVHYALWSHDWFSGNALFPGVLGLMLVGVAVARGIAFTDRRARMCLAFGLAGIVLSFGAAVPGYATLHRAIPLLQSIRVVSRFGYLEIVAVAIVAGFGAASLRRTLPRGWSRAFSAGALGLAILEPLAAPIELTRFDAISPIYDQLARESRAVVVEIPFYRPSAAFANARYMLNSTHHWRPLLNGHSGFLPASYQRHYEALSGFPDSTSIAALQGAGVTHVFVHTTEIGPDAVERLAHVPALRKMAEDGSTVLYRLEH
ncbi:MAG TPA: PA14 domain-containing protein [Vicinamibacterales bacterium]|nr:PA14 domain-containing protein [Vicinamibacterales bacterium]